MRVRGCDWGFCVARGLGRAGDVAGVDAAEDVARLCARGFVEGAWAWR